jgi:hypothetical protein
MSKKGASKQVWVESTSVTDSVRNFQDIMNRGSSAGKVYWDLPPSNRKERRIQAKYKRVQKNMGGNSDG